MHNLTDDDTERSSATVPQSSTACTIFPEFTLTSSYSLLFFSGRAPMSSIFLFKEEILTSYYFRSLLRPPYDIASSLLAARRLSCAFFIVFLASVVSYAIFLFFFFNF
ncbi:hypothetical protein RJT34_08013 [Clitoria ternatea]|uniref:Uncharacterized protein n=1 Tax=Clitoria ternatea TaxID=43366 RepID=A0AAN9K763_CLITE